MHVCTVAGTHMLGSSSKELPSAEAMLSARQRPVPSGEGQLPTKPAPLPPPLSPSPPPPSSSSSSSSSFCSMCAARFSFDMIERALAAWAAMTGLEHRLERVLALLLRSESSSGTANDVQEAAVEEDTRE